MISSFDLQAGAAFFVERMLNPIVAGIGIVLFAWMLLRLAGKQNSETRFAIWFSALLSIAVLPVFDLAHGSKAALFGRAPISFPVSWALYLFAAWTFIAAVGLVRVGMGLWQLRKLRNNSVPVPVPDLDPSLQKTLQEFGSIRSVTLCVSDDLRMPTAIGFVKPLVVIPSWAMKELATAELNSILLHELAHLRRWDDCTNLAQKVLSALFFFHPAVWWVAGRLTLEREMACDDLVLARTESPKAYAECLISLAEKGFLRRGLELAQAAVSRMQHTSLRIQQILDRNRPHATRVRKPALALVGGVAFSAMMAMPYLPQLVSFAGSGSPAQAAQASPSVGADFYKPKAVPVKLTTAAEAAPQMLTPVVTLRPRKTRVVPAQTAAPGESPRLAQVRRTQEAAPSAVFVVMRTQQFAGPDSVVWTFSVWRVTWITPAQRKVDNGSVAKAT